MAAAFGRLCVETLMIWAAAQIIPAAAFGRLCVETVDGSIEKTAVTSSRLRAAVC